MDRTIQPYNNNNNHLPIYTHINKNDIQTNSRGRFKYNKTKHN